MPIEITLFILFVTAAFLGICTAGFIVFSRFLGHEKERGRRFREMHGVKRKEDRP